MPHKISIHTKTLSAKDKENNEKIDRILKSIDFLKEEAGKMGHNDIYKLIDSFATCMHTYCKLKRNNLGGSRGMPTIEQD